MLTKKMNKNRKKYGGMTKNQKRKADYSAKADNENNRKGLFVKNRIRKIGQKGPHIMCGNIACHKCFYHHPDGGIYNK